MTLVAHSVAHRRKMFWRGLTPPKDAARRALQKRDRCPDPILPKKLDLRLKLEPSQDVQEIENKLQEDMRSIKANKLTLKL